MDKKVLNSVEDLIKYVEDHPSMANTRWSMMDNNTTEYVDPEAAGAWAAATPSYVHEGQPGRGEYLKAKEEHVASQPATIMRKTYILVYDASGGYYSRRHNSLELSVELGAILDSIWKHRPAYEGSTYIVRSGTLTIGGMLKRLGTDVEYNARIKAAVKWNEELNARRTRNGYRMRVQRLAAELIEEMRKGTERGCEWPATLTDLVSIELEPTEKVG